MKRLVVVILALAAVAPAALARDEPVSVGVTLDTTAVAPGATFRLGLAMRIAPGRHVLWHSSTVGPAPTLVVEAPPGFGVGPALWPVPERFRQGRGTAVGYRGELMPLVVITAPEKLEAEKVTLKVRAEYVAVDGKAVRIEEHWDPEVPVAENPRPRAREAFAAAAAAVPVPADSPASPVKVEASGGVPRGGNAGLVTVDATWRHAPHGVDWFPRPPKEVAIEQVKIETEGLRTRLTFRVELPPARPATPRRMVSILAYSDAKEVRRGVRLPIPLVAPPAEGERGDGD